MMSAPDHVNVDQLNNLLKKTSQLGVQPVSAQEFKPLAIELIDQLEEIYKTLSSYVPDNVMHNRWDYVERSRRAIRTSIRTLKKSIQT